MVSVLRTILSAPHGLLSLTVKKCPLLYFTQWEDCPGERERERACGEHQAGLEALRFVCQAFGFMRQQLPKVREWARPAKLSYSGSMGLRLGLGARGAQPVSAYD